jgi:hypothetical protein
MNFFSCSPFDQSVVFLYLIFAAIGAVQAKHLSSEAIVRAGSRVRTNAPHSDRVERGAAGSGRPLKHASN